ncbi:MAG TPA: multiheme c-type cytochrome, partial [Gammaproteobacteria bacterium]
MNPLTTGLRRLAMLLLCGLLATAGAAHAGALTLVYSGNLNGELEPCGCTVDTDYGGLLRRATFLDKLRADGGAPVVVTTGGLLTADIGADRIKARFILDGLAAIGYDAVGLQWADLVYGAGFLDQVALPYVASNWRGGQFPESAPIGRGETRLRYFQWLDPAQSPMRGMPGDNDPAGSDTTALAAALAAARAAGEITLLATTLHAAEAVAQLPLQDVAVLLVAAAGETPGEPAWHAGTLVLAPGTRGMRLGLAELEPSGDGRVRLAAHRVVELTNAIPDAARLAGWYSAYNDALRADYQRQVAERKLRAGGESGYLGARACLGCHATAAKAWQGSRHAHAFATLEKVGKAFDPNCVVCHSVAYGKPGGFLGLDETAELANVQCEACHGPGRDHVAAAGQSGYPGPQ